MSYALITGASKGIGKAIAYQLAARKTDLILVARTEKLLEEIASDLIKKYGITVRYYPVDLSENTAAENIKSWVNTHNLAISILVNNAGYGLSGSFENYSATDHAEMMQVNMTSLVKLTALFLPELKKQPKAYIMNIASSAAYQSVPYLGTYSASKAFVLSFSRALQYELKDTPVSVTCISPGGTDTDFGDRAKIGQRAIDTGKKLNMKPEQVAAIAVRSMYQNKTEVITGAINKFGAFMVWLAPKKLAEKIAAQLYQ